MTLENSDYSLFTDFFEAFSHVGVEGIGSEDSILMELERVTEQNKQIFYISDAIMFDILFISKGVQSMFGIKQEKVSPGFFLTTTIPEDFKRHQLARSHLISLAQKLYVQKSGTRIISTNVRARKPDGSYIHLLYQANIFYSKVPYESVFLMLVITDISKYLKNNKGFHYYTGEDRSLFRFPDNELLKTGIIYTHTEFEILQLIEQGLSSKEIANKLFRSPYTISTHRTNILKKSGNSSVADVIRYLKESGML